MLAWDIRKKRHITPMNTAPAAILPPTASQPPLGLSWLRSSRQPGWEREFELFVRDNAGWMLNSARRMLAAAPAADAQDFVQEALVLLLQKRPKLPAEAAANAWLHRTLVFMIQNHLKKQRRRERLLDNQPANENPAESVQIGRAHV